MPIYTWETIATKPIIAIQWSTCRQSVFYALGQHHIFAWDILQSPNVPIVQEEFKKGSTVTSISVSEEKVGTRAPAVALAYNDGHTEVHILSNRLVNKVNQEDSKFTTFLNSLM